MLSPHYPSLAGNIVTVPAAGELVINTGLRELQTFVASIKLADPAANEEAVLSWYIPAGDELNAHRHVVVRIEKGGSGSGTIGDTATDIGWFALGK